LDVEKLEGRQAPATLVAPTKLTYQDSDGDSVVVALSRPLLNNGNVNAVFSFSAGSVNGNNTIKQQLRSINLAVLAAAAAGTSVTLTATRSAAHGGDGLAALGQIDAAGIDLGAVSIDGDLGRVVAGDGVTATAGLTGLTAQSLGRYGTSTGAASLFTTIQGRLGFLKVKSDVKEASVEVQGGPEGRLGLVSIGGSLLGGAANASGRVYSTGDMGFVTILGNLTGAGGIAS